MQRFYEFLKATIVGGVFVLVPLAVLGVIVVKAFEVVHGVLQPLVAMLPIHSLFGVSLAFCAAVLVLILLCFVAGLIAELALTRRLIEGVESLILARLPGYSLMKSVGESFVGVEGKELRKTVLVQTSWSRQIGFLMEELPDGMLVVFIPGVPHTMSGAVHIVPRDRVEEIAMTVHAALESLGRLGVGLRQNWPAAPTE